MDASMSTQAQSNSSNAIKRKEKGRRKNESVASLVEIWVTLLGIVGFQRRINPNTNSGMRKNSRDLQRLEHHYGPTKRLLIIDKI